MFNLFNNLKIKYCFIFLFIIGCLITSCKDKDNIYVDNDGNKVYDLSYFKEASVIIPKNQTYSQSLSIIVKNSNGEMIIFDGGRIEDADYLRDIIKANGGVVVAWYLTHIHDDHIGALYQILNKKYDDIVIKNLYYKFADFEWYYKNIGKDAGIVHIFEETLKNFSGNINNSICKGEIFNFNNVQVQVLNNIYKIDSDPINNSSIAYRINIEGKSMIVLGDLGYRGGEKLLNETELKDLKSDILVLSHHGQNGVPGELYYVIMPEVVIWPTSRDIYENKNKKFDTDATKGLLSAMNVKYNILSFQETSIIK